MGGSQVSAGEAMLNRHGIPTFPYPDTAARIFCLMWRYSYNLGALYETPALVGAGTDLDRRRRVGAVMEEVRRAGRTLLTEPEAKTVLAAYGIPVVETRLADSEAAAAQAAAAIGYPVVLKLFSATIVHNTDVGGVELNLGDEAAVRRAYRDIESSVEQKAGPGHFRGVTVQPMVASSGYELIIGSTLDPQFGPVLLFGLGGQLVEVFKDHALALPPLNTTLARRLMEQTQVFRALSGVRGRRPVDLSLLEQVLVRFSELAIENRLLKEIEINPLFVSGEKLIALDARAVLYPREVHEDQIPAPAIRPYPAQYAGSWTAREGLALTIRPIRPEDEPLMVKFHQTLSESTVYLRYFHMLSLGYRVSHERLTRICFIDYDREMALVAIYHNPASGEESILPVGRLTKLHGVNEAEVALVVADAFHRRGIGTELLRRLVEIGRQEKLDRIVADMLPDNFAMQHLCQKLGFRMDRSSNGTTVHAVLDLSTS